MSKRTGLRLRNHQQENLDFFRTKDRALSLLPYGSGKTIVAIMRLGDLVPKVCALVVTTNGTVLKWMADFKVWGHPKWKVITFSGTREERRNAFNSLYDVAVINYEGLAVMLDEFGVEFCRKHKAVIFDEIHRLKNPEAEISKNSALISHPNYAQQVYGMTGRPALESPLDIFSIMKVVNPFIFGDSYEAWVERYFEKVSVKKVDGGKGYPELVPKHGAVNFLHEQLHAISFRKERDQVEVVYPSQDFGNPILVSMKGETRDRYHMAERRLSIDLARGLLPLVHIYARLEKLCQISRGWCYDIQKKPVIFDHFPGIEAAGNHLEDIRKTGRVVIWAVRAPDMAMLSHLLSEMGLRHRVIHSGVRNMKRREAMMGSFNYGNLDAIIANPKCIGEGTDIAAEHSLRYSYRWSFMEWDQSIGRFARMNSLATIVSYRDIVVEGSPDISILASLRNKFDMAQMIVQSRKIPWRSSGAEEMAVGLNPDRS